MEAECVQRGRHFRVVSSGLDRRWRPVLANNSNLYKRFIREKYRELDAVRKKNENEFV